MIQCPVCRGRELAPVVLREQVPVHQNLVMQTQAVARDCTKGNLDLYCCDDCGFVFNRQFDLSLLSYGDRYDNSQNHSGCFVAYIDALVEQLVQQHGVKNATIVEVGCGSGLFLRKLVSYPGANNRGVGFDPSYQGPLTDEGGRLQFRQCYYDASCTDVPADVVICRHVIEHVPAPLALLQSIKAAIAGKPAAKLFFETPCVDWILSNKVVWDFFYEHCSLFSRHSLSRVFSEAGFSVHAVNHIFNSQYLWLEATVAETDGAEAVPENITPALAAKYRKDEAVFLRQITELLTSCQKKGRVALWGAGAKGVTLASLLDADARLIDALIDINPNKQGHFVPGSAHPIIAPAQIAEHGIASIILMNPNYRHEVETLLAACESKVSLYEWSVQ
ncbi:class I SAM-dependent methyltransferase [Rheinheimera marina]|uniref:Class I SAM-dependent methyltransferase n=1 Tax=Rheinheimera marina TaxID=1774958 RepID=A0ABV9JRR6_9GAMM